jgi:hypothetical protein
MVKWFKKYFIPHDDNGHKPHFLRGKTAVIAVSAILALETLFLAETLLVAPNSKFAGTILPAVIAEITNQNRVENGLQELKADDKLTEAAKLKAEDMAAKGYFAHVSPEGVDPWHWIDSVGYEYVRAGENLAVNFVDSKDVVDAWMASASHKANIMKSSFSEIGVATASGTYKGRSAIFIVELFAEPYKPLAADPAELPELLPEGSGQATAPKGSGTDVLGAYDDRSSVISSVAAAPRRSLNIVYIVFGTIVLLSILLAVFVKRNIQHPSLVVNGAAILMVISAAMAINRLLLVAGGNIS